MRLARRREPTMVTPNELEAEELVGHEFADDDDRLRGLQEIVELGAGRGGDDARLRLHRPGRGRPSAGCTA